jgi:hypothetical protein
MSLSTGLCSPPADWKTRLLLLSNTVQPVGLGNGNDLVGRYFMDHPYLPWSAIARYGTPDPPLPYTLAPPDSTAFATLAPTERDGIARSRATGNLRGRRPVGGPARPADALGVAIDPGAHPPGFRRCECRDC